MLISVNKIKKGKVNVKRRTARRAFQVMQQGTSARV
jgi:hypothetical protein